MSARYEPVIGLEVHVQLLTRSKLFCACANRFGDPPNANVCPFCLGHPGVLPSPNREAVSLALRMGLALGSDLQMESTWARKNYFYPDLPKGYQITQYDRPICLRGALTIHLDEPRVDPEGQTLPGHSRTVPLERIHLEEDAGKSKHPERVGETRTRVDLNRAGAPLIEIVSEPVLHSAGEAVSYLATLRQLVQYCGVGDGNMEEGSFRCDANVSMRPLEQSELGTRVELKNMNSFRFVERALRFEIERQTGELEAGRPVEQETRLWDVQAGRTRSMRGKEEAQDYRYFPEPDLPPLVITPDWIEEVRTTLPELPDARRNRFVREYGLGTPDAAVLTRSRELADYYEAVVENSGDADLSAKWVRGELLSALHREGLDPANAPVSPERLGELLRLLRHGSLSGRLAKDAFAEMCETGDPAPVVVARHGWEVVADDAALGALIDDVVRDHPDEVADYREGKESLLRFFVGQVMKASRGQADPARTKALLERALRG